MHIHIFCLIFIVIISSMSSCHFRSWMIMVLYNFLSLVTSVSPFAKSLEYLSTIHPSTNVRQECGLLPLPISLTLDMPGGSLSLFMMRPKNFNCLVLILSMCSFWYHFLKMPPSCLFAPSIEFSALYS